MNLSGAVLLDRPTDRRGISKLDRPKVIGFKKNGDPIYQVGGSTLNTWCETLNTLHGDGFSLSNSTTATSLLGGTAGTIASAQAKTTLPGSGFWSEGKMLRITFAGRLSNIVTTPGTLTLDVRLGAVIAFNGGAMQMSSTAHTTVPIFGTILLTCRTIGGGTTATLMGQATVTSQALSLTAVADSTTTPATLPAPNTTPAVGTGFDSTASQVLDFFGTFSIANAGNLLQLHQYAVEAMN
jgi:hypothetical protein